ncbi:Lysine exporter protein (LYSE/YGGA) [Arcobacter nitrofigilis DSM 7299]|uniref:Lysine exporter protein (LYSE/YGGA) n=1 Tax=Arcobacter nitrofigilis (strain ATCC 33309 / DSM 7299 / CCUG 15893 / LMG 7604 / NCTC 12251 / CI) TaxID=572480 RepID=D5V040_ARCNC|nr:LysE family translocator [Arcobacter nitrofigilis]ADG93652.1 Lysine exporter protein (LYSE/YGGA) [Arcobacter nitrofigilis DSM 7299]
MNFVFFLLYCSLMIITPGPTNIMILTTVHNYGVKKAFEFSIGALFAFFVLLSISVIFNSILMNYLPNIIVVLQIIGAIYMLYLAYQIFKINNTSKKENQFSSFKTGFLMQFVNPKPVLFTLTVFPSFILPYYTSFGYLTLFVLLITIIACLAFLSWILFGKVLKSFLDRYNKLVNNIMAIFLIICAIAISGIFN